MSKILQNQYLKLIRFDKPIGTWLLFLPCFYGLILAFKQNGKTPDNFLYFLILFFFGSFLMRSAGCIINDILDRNFDAKVKRTNNRAIASGKISIKNALIFLFILLFFALLILLQFNLMTIFLGFVSVIMVSLYPIMKRLTFYPQIFLGFTFNLGVLFASTAVLGKITFPALLLYGANIFWTIIYDTIYGYQDLEDDIKIGVKSSSIKFGYQPERIFYGLIAVYSVLMLILGFWCKLKVMYFFLIFLTISHLIYQVKSCNFSDDKDCLKKFKSNIWVAIITFLAIALG